MVARVEAQGNHMLLWQIYCLSKAILFLVHGKFIERTMATITLHTIVNSFWYIIFGHDNLFVYTMKS